LVGLGAVVVVPAVADAPQPPANDNYISSLELNRPKHRLNRTKTLETFVDTTSATVQSNIFNPCGLRTCPSGPPEVTSCHGVGYGKTTWYDFYPDTNGTVRIRTSGFDNVITLYRFSVHTVLPDVAHRQCIHMSSSPFEELDARVKKGRAYTIQIGGAVSSSSPNGAGGQLQLLFDYFATPRRLAADSFLKARALSNGIQLLDLRVTTTRGAHVRVACGGHCSPQSKFGRAVEDFSRLNGVRMPAGSKLQIRVTARGSIGALIQYNILPGSFAKHTFCTEPGSRKPRRTCH